MRQRLSDEPLYCLTCGKSFLNCFSCIAFLAFFKMCVGACDIRLKTYKSMYGVKNNYKVNAVP